MRIVLDTNVLVSGLLTPFGTCGDIVRMLTAGEVTLCVDARILLEYDEVLHRPRFSIDSAKADILIEFIRNSSETHAAMVQDISLPDADDNAFLEVALSAGAACLVTGNQRHYPVPRRGGVPVLSPKDFIGFRRTHRTTA